MTGKRRVPEVLWRLFRNRARTLASTIASLLPSPALSSSECQCGGFGCLVCGGAEAISFLVRPEDPADYLKLLNRCFVVVSDDAPPLSHFYPHCHWSQAQIVQRTIEMMMYEEPISPNVIFNGYDKINHTGPNMKLLCSSAWCLLLQRVGDDVMVYLLKYTSMFLPLSNRIHHQVVGCPISSSCLELSKRSSESQNQNTAGVQCGSKRKRASLENVNLMLERQKLDCSNGVDNPSSSVSGIASNFRRRLSSFSRLRGEKHSQIGELEATTPVIGTVTNNTGGDSTVELQGSSTLIAAKYRKRKRPFSWQRRREQKHVNFEEIDDMISCPPRLADNSSLSGGLECDVHEKRPLQSSCFLEVKADQPLLVAKVAHINRQSMFHDLECSASVFPRKHILNSLKPNISDANFLGCTIFGLSEVNVSVQSTTSFPSSGLCRNGSSCMHHSLVKLFKSLIRRALCCQHFRLFDKHCAAQDLDRQATGKSITIFEVDVVKTDVLEKHRGFNTAHFEDTPNSVGPQFEANMSHCLRTQVVSFIWAVIRSIVPPELLGTSYNWRRLRRNIAKFIQLRRFEKFSLKQCMHKLKASRFPFLSTQHLSTNQVLKYPSGQSVASHVFKQKLLQSWIFWLFSCLVVPLVQANFYVTETEHGKQDVFYYRKPLWEKLKTRAITCLKDQNYHELDASAVRNIISKRLFGFSKLRLLPKDNGMRMLANLKASSRMPAQESSLEDQSRGIQRNGKFHPRIVKYKNFKSVNSVLHDTHAVLKGLQLKEPEKLGSSVFDYNGVYRKLCPFLIGMKNRLTAMAGFFVVVSDVSRAFDFVDQDKLLSIMKDVILDDDYLLIQSDQVACTKKTLWVHKNLALVNENIGTTSVTSSVPSWSQHTVLVTQGWSRHVKKQELFFTLKEHVKYNVLQLDKKFYLQGVGIPQGSILSSLLCSLYFGHLERNVIFPFLEKTCESASKDISRRHICRNVSEQEGREDKFDSSPDYLLLRFIDDFLFISTSKKQAASFFSRLQRGFRNYNCFMNDDKFSVNFDIGHTSGIPSNRIYVGEDHISFLRWSGLLINCRTLEVQADYTKYLNNHLRSTLTVCWHGKPGRSLKEKLRVFIRPKCHPIFFDSNINSAAVVRLNIYQVFVLCAMKFHCYVRDLSYICKLQTGFYLKVVERSVRYMYVQIKRRMRSAYHSSDFRPVLDVVKGEVEWLGLHAYIQVLKKKESRYKKLLSSLRWKLAQGAPKTLPSELEYAVAASHSSLIWKIKY